MTSEAGWTFDTAVFDGDILRYEIGSLTDEHPFLPNGPRVPVDVQFIYDRVDDRINRARTVTGCKKLIVFLTGTGNFRFDIAKTQTYKGNRTGLEHPFHYETVGRYLIERYGAVVVTGMEADDAMALYQRSHSNTIICSRDKDLLTVPGWHYRWACGEHQPEVLPHLVEELDAHRNFYRQMLTGDSTDNILGCAIRRPTYRGGTEIKSRYSRIPFKKPRKLIRFKLGATLYPNWRVGVGKVEALKVVGECNSVAELHEAVTKLYKIHVPETWEESMLENARLLYMGQTKDSIFEWEWIL